MDNHLIQLFTDENTVNRIKDKLPMLFQLAEVESSRAGKLGMEIGSVRERILIALLMHKFGEENVMTYTPITQAEVDVILFNNPISIKTISGSLSGIKLIWTVDAQKAKIFYDNYLPSVDMLLAQIKWNQVGYLFYFPAETQVKIFDSIGRERYLKLPKEGTNPRGVEVTKEAVELMAKENLIKKVDISWNRLDTTIRIYDRWVEMWNN